MLLMVVIWEAVRCGAKEHMLRMQMLGPISGHRLLCVQLWADYLTLLGLSFFTCEIGMIILVPIWGRWEG